jgi:hypothetical protein
MGLTSKYLNLQSLIKRNVLETSGAACWNGVRTLCGRRTRISLPRGVPKLNRLRIPPVIVVCLVMLVGVFTLLAKLALSPQRPALPASTGNTLNTPKNPMPVMVQNETTTETRVVTPAKDLPINGLLCSGPISTAGVRWVSFIGHATLGRAGEFDTASSKTPRQCSFYGDPPAATMHAAQCYFSYLGVSDCTVSPAGTQLGLEVFRVAGPFLTVWLGIGLPTNGALQVFPGK